TVQSMPLCRWGATARGSKPDGNGAQPMVSRGVLRVHLHWAGPGGGEPWVTFSEASLTAEEVCIYIAHKIGITPLCFNLFALFDAQGQVWLPPNHILEVPRDSSLNLHFRMRFYFRNWHGMNPQEPAVYRCGPPGAESSSDQAEHGLQFLDPASFEYIFEQGKHEFVNDVASLWELSSEEEIHHFKNESLGMAFLHLCHLALHRGVSLEEVAKKISFKDCIPRSFRSQIQQHNALTRLRLRSIFHKFLRAFQPSHLSQQLVMVKYLATLERLAPCFATEHIPVCHLELPAQAEGKLCYIQDHGQATLDPGKESALGPPTHEVLVTGTGGIQWRPVQAEGSGGSGSGSRNPQANLSGKKAQAQEVDLQPASRPKGLPWASFCDFQDISHLVVKEHHVSVYCQDNKCLELTLPSRATALSFVSLVDGYFRLTVDSSHYLCHEVAPPRLVMSIQDGIHGPLLDPFVLAKLQPEDGHYLIHWSSSHLYRLILTVAQRDQAQGSRSLRLRKFTIEQQAGTFTLEGWDRSFPSVGALRAALQDCSLRVGDDCFSLRRCCLPLSRELSNLIIMRGPAASTRPLNLSQLSFHRVCREEITQLSHLGQGTRTNVYEGLLRVKGRDSEEDKEEGGDPLSPSRGSGQELRVVLKVLDPSHHDITLAFYEIASLMSQVSHVHLAFVHGICVHGSESECPLPLLIGQLPLIPSPWPVVAIPEPLTCTPYPGYTPTLNLRPFPWLHLNSQIRPQLLTTPPQASLYPDPTPWLHHECLHLPPKTLYNPAPIFPLTSLALTLCDTALTSALQFNPAQSPLYLYPYCVSLKIPVLSTPSPASITSYECLTYEPAQRPSFRIILRDLTRLQPHNLVDVSAVSPDLPASDPTVFHKRYLKKIRELGEGHFGKVSLYCYDPTNDGTGEMVAVKSLKAGCGPQLRSGWKREIDILRRLYHEHIVKYKGCCEDPGEKSVQLVMEYVPLGSLRDYLPRHSVGLAQLLLFAQQICEGMAYLHAQHYIHRDLAARNVLLDNDRLVKIGDFGLAKAVPEGHEYYRVREDGDSPVFWYAPECLKECKFYYASDVWSFGVTLYELLTRCDFSQSPPLKFIELLGLTQGQMTVLRLTELLERGERLPRPEACPCEIYYLMKNCWEAEASFRPTFQNLIPILKTVHEKYQGQAPSVFSMC
uniref:Tyrosine-protein kinase n=1 Tax=Loxodonta africana TaxID=9785 RepID=G3STB4_LOXAF